MLRVPLGVFYTETDRPPMRAYPFITPRAESLFMMPAISLRLSSSPMLGLFPCLFQFTAQVGKLTRDLQSLSRSEFPDGPGLAFPARLHNLGFCQNVSPMLSGTFYITVVELYHNRHIISASSVAPNHFKLPTRRRVSPPEKLYLQISCKPQRYIPFLYVNAVNPDTHFLPEGKGFFPAPACQTVVFFVKPVIIISH